GRLHEAGEQRRFLHVEIARVLAEEAARGRFDAIEAVAEIHLVQIELEDLVLGELALEPPREHRLFQLAPQRLVRREETLARELLRQRASTLRRAMRAQVVERRGEYPYHVDAAVIVKALILDRDDRVHQVRRDVRQRRLDALLLEDRERRPVVLVVQRRRLCHGADVAHLLGARQIVEDRIRQPDRRREDEQRERRGDRERGANRVGMSSLDVCETLARFGDLLLKEVHHERP